MLAPEGVCCLIELPADWFSNDSEALSRGITHANNSRVENTPTQEAFRRDAKPNREERSELSKLSREYIESALRVVDDCIAAGEHRLFEHVKLMERLKDSGTESNMTMAHRLRKNLEAGLLRSRARREELLKDLEQD